MDTKTARKTLSVRKLVRSLRTNGPLATVQLSSTAMQYRLSESSAWRPVFLSIDKALVAIQQRIDSRFDRKYGTDTSGVIALSDLPIPNESVKFGHHYEPTSVKTFNQIMSNLGLNHADFEFVDFGSGKGRILLLASRYPFRRIVGVEFAPDLNAVASKNVEIWDRRRHRATEIEIVTADAADFLIPDSPLVAFFFSPFKGELMRRVVGNITASWSTNPRPIYIIFYGGNRETPELLRATGFGCKEIDLRVDCGALQRGYQGLLLASPDLTAPLSRG